jgi:hypothetical protein
MFHGEVVEGRFDEQPVGCGPRRSILALVLALDDPVALSTAVTS